MASSKALHDLKLRLMAKASRRAPSSASVDRGRGIADHMIQVSGPGSVNVQVRGADNVVAGGDLVLLEGRRPPVEQAEDLIEQADDPLAWVDDLDTSNPPPAGPGPDAGIFRLLGYLIRLRLWRRSERLRARRTR